MLNSLIRVTVAIIGFLIGYTLSLACKNVILSVLPNKTFVENLYNGGLSWIVAFIFTVVFFFITPIFISAENKGTKKISKEFEKLKPEEIIFTTIGLILGMIIALLLSFVWNNINNTYVAFLFSTLSFLLFGYIGGLIGYKRGKDILNMFLDNGNPKDGETLNTKIATSKVIDTSILIDGRIYDLIKGGYIEGKIIIPDFVIIELQTLSDSSKAQKRIRGRKGLDVADRIMNDFKIEVYKYSNPNLENEPVDLKLVELAKTMKAKLVTNDFNLTKVAKISNVKVMSIQEISILVKAKYEVEEDLFCTPVKEGEGKNQGVAYLEDGTMIIVENGQDSLNKNIHVQITRVLEAQSGKLYFAKIID